MCVYFVSMCTCVFCTDVSARLCMCVEVCAGGRHASVARVCSEQTSRMCEAPHPGRHCGREAAVGGVSSKVQPRVAVA